MTLTEIIALVGGIIGGIVGPTATVATLHINRLRERDKLQHDQDIATLNTRCLAAELAAANCDKTHKEVEETARTERARREEATEAVARMEGVIGSSQRQIADMRGEIQELRDRLYGKGKVVQ